MLSGTLAEVSLPGLLQLLSTERRGGRLAVSGDGVRGFAWLEGGRIVHAEATGRGGSVAGPEALHALVAVETGDFTFELGFEPPRRTVTDSTEHVLVEAACRRDHARRGPAPVPASAIPIFAPVPAGSATPRFNTLQWRMLASIDGVKDVARLAAELGLPVEGACTLVSEMVEAGVVELA